MPYKITLFLASFMYICFIWWFTNMNYIRYWFISWSMNITFGQCVVFFNKPQCCSIQQFVAWTVTSNPTLHHIKVLYSKNHNYKPVLYKEIHPLRGSSPSMHLHWHLSLIILLYPQFWQLIGSSGHFKARDWNDKQWLF